MGFWALGVFALSIRQPTQTPNVLAPAATQISDAKADAVVVATPVSSGQMPPAEMMKAQADASTPPPYRSQPLEEQADLSASTKSDFCLSEVVYTMLWDVNARVSKAGGGSMGSRGHQLELYGLSQKAGAVVILVVLLFLAIFLTFFGQMLVHTSTLLVTWFVTFLCTFALLFTWSRPTGASRPTSVPCILPFVLALVLAVAVTALVQYLAKRVKWLIPFIFGLAAGTIFCAFIRQIILAASPQIASHYAFDYFWLAASVVIGLTAVLAVCTMNERNESAVVLLVCCTLGGYGIATSLSALVMLYSASGIQNWAFFVVMICMALTGFLVQYCFTGDKASEHREATRKRVRGMRAGEFSEVDGPAGDARKAPLVQP